MVPDAQLHGLNADYDMYQAFAAAFLHLVIVLNPMFTVLRLALHPCCSFYLIGKRASSCRCYNAPALLKIVDRCG